MSDIAIRVENLSKRYRIGLKEEIHDTLGGAIADFVKRPVKNLQRLRKLSRFQDDGHDPEDIIWALKDVSFEVKRGEVIGVIGRNGAGKSTLLKILSRITEPTEGRVIIKGRVSSLLEVGTGFHPELTGRENVYLNGTILGMRKTEIDRKFDEIVAFAEVERFIDTPVKRYSSGMKVRLAFAVAAHLEPEILLVDEVLAVGDVAFQKKCLGRMNTVAREGRTVLFVSHNMGAITSLCPRGILLGDGAIVIDDDSKKAVSHYLNETWNSKEFNLAARKDRYGNGVIRFSGFWIQNVSGEKVLNVASGDSVVFVFDYSCHSETSISKSVGCFVRIRDYMGNLLCMLNTHYAGYILAAYPPGGYWTCTIESLPFSPGRYTVELWCGDGNHVFDHIERAGFFEVIEGDFYGTGRMPRTKANEGQFLLQQDWSGKVDPKIQDDLRTRETG